ncbi:MAG: GntR family transcriptional regulator [Paracoccaceae bacterium]|jgi:DNA-binding GntR family transcriptional regulator
MLFGKRTDEDDTVVAMLAAALRRDISFGALLPDQKLKIEALRQRYGGSSHSMRETLRLLSAEGLVEATSQRGFRVMSATEDDLRDILLMRLHVEKLGLERSMARATVDWEGRVIAALHALRRAEEKVQADPDDLTALEWDEACRAVSAVLVEASGSARLIDLQRKFYNQSRRFRLALLREGRLDFGARAARQSALQEAILNKSADRALTLLEEDIRADLTGKT